MKYDRTSVADVYEEADFRLPRINLFRRTTVKCEKEEKTNFPMTVQSPNHKAVSGPSLPLTSVQGMKR